LEDGSEHIDDDFEIRWDEVGELLDDGFRDIGEWGDELKQSLEDALETFKKNIEK